MIEVKNISEDALRLLAAKIGGMVSGNLTIELIGDVGAGKTTFTKGLAKGLQVADDVQSPTFTLSRVYEARDGLRLAHYDFYRLKDAGVMAIELAEARDDPQTITVVEWGDIVADILPDTRLTITLVADDDTHRTLTIDSKSERLLDQVREAIGV